MENVENVAQDSLSLSLFPSKATRLSSEAAVFDRCLHWQTMAGQKLHVIECNIHMHTHKYTHTHGTNMPHTQIPTEAQVADRKCAINLLV